MYYIIGIVNGYKGLVSSYWWPFLQESGPEYVHPETAKLGRMRVGNETRDWWRAHKIPVASWLGMCETHFVVCPQIIWFFMSKKSYSFAMAAQCRSKEIEYIWVPVSDEKVPHGYRIEKQPILFPHCIIAYLFNNCGLDIPMAAIHEFWDHAIADGETYASHDSRNRIPLGFYGDAAQLITKVRIEKLICFFCNIVIFRPKSIRYSRFLLWSCDTSLLYKNRTVNTILRWLVWSFNALYEGTFPVARPGNRPLEAHERDRAGQWLTHRRHLFQVVELRGDWEFHKMIWQFKASWKGGVNVGICYRCPAMGRCDDSGLFYWNMDDENSSWARQEFNTIDYLAKRLPANNLWTSVLLLCKSSFWGGTMCKPPNHQSPNHFWVYSFFGTMRTRYGMHSYQHKWNCLTWQTCPLKKSQISRHTGPRVREVLCFDCTSSTSHASSFAWCISWI